MKCSLFPFFLLFVVGRGGGGDLGSGSGSKFNCAARVGSGQTISGTGRVRASVLSPCRPLRRIHGEIARRGTCFCINERWCTDVTVLKKMYCSTRFINCKPFYSPWEFCSFILVSVYIHPQAHVSLALQKLADQITEREQHPDSVLIILRDFNKTNLSSELPKYRQHLIILIS